MRFRRKRPRGPPHQRKALVNRLFLFWFNTWKEWFLKDVFLKILRLSAGGGGGGGGGGGVGSSSRSERPLGWNVVVFLTPREPYLNIKVENLLNGSEECILKSEKSSVISRGCIVAVYLLLLELEIWWVWSEYVWNLWEKSK